jgi:hypothetical protein
MEHSLSARITDLVEEEFSSTSGAGPSLSMREDDGSDEEERKGHHSRSAKRSQGSTHSPRSSSNDLSLRLHASPTASSSTRSAAHRREEAEAERKRAQEDKVNTSGQ